MHDAHLKDLFVIHLAAARDPDGHIVCHPGKFARHCQAMEGHFRDIRAATLSLRDIFSHFAQKEQRQFEALETEHPLKVIESITSEITAVSEYKIDSEISSNWVKEEYLPKFGVLSPEQQSTLTEYYDQLVDQFKQELLRSRDTLSTEEIDFAHNEIAGYLNLKWFM